MGTHLGWASAASGLPVAAQAEQTGGSAGGKEPATSGRQKNTCNKAHEGSGGHQCNSACIDMNNSRSHTASHGTTFSRHAKAYSIGLFTPPSPEMAWMSKNEDAGGHAGPPTLPKATAHAGFPSDGKSTHRPTPGPSEASGTASTSTSSYQPPSEARVVVQAPCWQRLGAPRLKQAQLRPCSHSQLTASVPVIKIWHGLIGHLRSISRLLHKKESEAVNQAARSTPANCKRSAPHSCTCPTPHLLLLGSPLAFAPLNPGCFWHRGAEAKEGEAVWVGRHKPSGRHASRNGSTHCGRHGTGNKPGRADVFQTQRTHRKQCHRLLRQRASNERCVQGRPPRR